MFQGRFPLPALCFCVETAPSTAQSPEQGAFQLIYHHGKILAEFNLAVRSQIRQSAKLNSPPNFPAVRYFLNCSGVCLQTCKCFRGMSPLHDDAKAWVCRTPTQRYKWIRRTQRMANLIYWTKWSKGHLKLRWYISFQTKQNWRSKL